MAATTARRLTSAPFCATSKPPHNSTAGPPRYLGSKANSTCSPSIARHPQPSTLNSQPRIYLSTGIHGDEPAGPLAALRLLQENQWPANAELWFCPCLNPMGFVLNRRENDQGIDLNRQYRHLETAERARTSPGWNASRSSTSASACMKTGNRTAFTFMN